MAQEIRSDPVPQLAIWEREVYARHRWANPFWAEHGQGDRVREEHARLNALWEELGSLDEIGYELASEIISLEICNWRLEESIVDLCAAIGTSTRLAHPVGHKASLTDERWLQIWGYCFALRDWLPGPLAPRSRGYGALLAACDPSDVIQERIRAMLGQPTELKQLYVELFCLDLQELAEGDWGSPPPRYVQAMSNWHAREGVMEQIGKYDHDEELVNAIVRGNYQPCHHKAFRHFDITISSIGAGKWRGAMPVEGMGRATRYALMDAVLAPLESWVAGEQLSGTGESDPTWERIHRLLGKPDGTKVFLVSLLASLLRSQQLREAGG
jgi:hypothetical protein